MKTLPEAIHKRLADEFRFAADRMAESPDPRSKLYFFSAFFGELNRAFNQFWDPDLALLHLVVQKTHEQINGRINTPLTGAGIPPELPHALDRLGDQLAMLFSEKTVTDRALKRVLTMASTLGYAVTGNGYYLYLKGQLKI
jgi:hypothetical protein